MAALHNFSIGIDWIGDPTGATALIKHRFISKGGSDVTPDGLDPETPYITIAAALNAGAAFDTYVIGSGVYNEVLLNTDDSILKGDGLVYIIGDSVNKFANGTSDDSEFHNLYIKNYPDFFDTTGRRAEFYDCLLENTTIIQTGSSDIIYFYDSKFINCNIIDVGIMYSYRGVYLNTPWTITHSSVGKVTTLESNYFDATSLITYNDTGGTFNYEYNNNRAGVTAPPTTDVGNINADPLFKGDPLLKEFVIETNSPNIGAGNSGVTIGKLQTGSLQNTDSPNFGAGLGVIGNTQFTAGELEKVNAGLIGERESTTIDLGKIYSSPTPDILGDVDYLNNVPYKNAITNPSHLNIEVRYSTDNITFTAYKPFKVNSPLYLDSGGFSTGEADFNWGDVIVQKMRYIDFKVTMPITYTEG